MPAASSAREHGSQRKCGLDLLLTGRRLGEEQLDRRSASAQRTILSKKREREQLRRLRVYTRSRW
jgi:hypothetical protein